MAIRLYGHHYIEHNGKHLAYVKGAVKIGKFTFVGPHSVIMPGTTIGKGSIVSAYSMVKGEFPDFSVIAGNPAKVVGDTREIDAKMLGKYPELQNYYDEWAKE
jgi:acetyltransferase-like isoleucine patch superfamily enzyme